MVMGVWRGGLTDDAHNGSCRVFAHHIYYLWRSRDGGRRESKEWSEGMWSVYIHIHKGLFSQARQGSLIYRNFPMKNVAKFGDEHLNWLWRSAWNADFFFFFSSLLESLANRKWRCWSSFLVSLSLSLHACMLMLNFILHVAASHSGISPLLLFIRTLFYWSSVW